MFFQTYKATAVDMLEFIDGCIEATHLNASERGGTYNRGEHDALHKLVELRQKWHTQCPPAVHPSKRHAPPPPQVSSCQLLNHNMFQLLLYSYRCHFPINVQHCYEI